MNIREGFHRIGSVLAVITVLIVALIFVVVQKDLNENGFLFFAGAAVILATLAYGAAASIGWIISGFRERA